MSTDDLQEFYSELGQRIRNARKKAEIRQERLAEVLGLARASIVNIEKGRQRPSIHLLMQIASALKISYMELMPEAIPNKSQPVLTDLEKVNSLVNTSTRSAIANFVSHVNLKK